jgi:hypothetical protein
LVAALTQKLQPTAVPPVVDPSGARRDAAHRLGIRLAPGVTMTVSVRGETQLPRQCAAMAAQPTISAP